MNKIFIAIVSFAVGCFGTYYVLKSNTTAVSVIPTSVSSVPETEHDSMKIKLTPSNSKLPTKSAKSGARLRDSLWIPSFIRINYNTANLEDSAEIVQTYSFNEVSELPIKYVVGNDTSEVNTKVTASCVFLGSPLYRFEELNLLIAPFEISIAKKDETNWWGNIMAGNMVGVSVGYKRISLGTVLSAKQSQMFFIAYTFQF